MTASTDHSSDHDVVDVLTTDHREALELVEQIHATTDPAQRRDLADSLISELVRHSVAEEMFVYPAVEKHLPDGEQRVEHDKEEHKELERIMKRIESADTATPDFESLMRGLERVLRDHVQDEEGEQFPLLRRHVSAEELVRLKTQVEAAKKIAPTRPHPSAPNDKLFHMLVGPGVGLVDRLRDRLTGRNT